MTLPFRSSGHAQVMQRVAIVAASHVMGFDDNRGGMTRSDVRVYLRSQSRDVLHRQFGPRPQRKSRIVLW